MGEVLNKKVMAVREAPTVRGLIKIANELNIPREDVVTILPIREGYILIYYEEKL
jgi:hypothetical protein